MVSVSNRLPLDAEEEAHPEPVPERWSCGGHGVGIAPVPRADVDGFGEGLGSSEGGFHGFSALLSSEIRASVHWTDCSAQSDAFLNSYPCV